MRSLAETNQQDDRDPRAGSPPADLDACVSGLVNAVEKGMAQEVTPYGLVPVEFNLLRICLEMGKETTATQLALLLPVDASRISRIVTGLVDRGLLRRRRLRQDRRVVMLRLSDEGRELTSQVMERMKSYDAQLTEGVGEDEMRAFASVTARIVANHAAMQQPE